MRMQMEGADPSGRYALLLSGGLDSRALLAAAEQPPLCVTTCVKFNNEAAVAQEVAQARGAAFEFVPRPPQAYEGHVADAIWYGGGQHLFTEAHFIDYASRVNEPGRCFFIGLGLDVFLGGLYLPKDPVRWLGRGALHYELRPIDDLTSNFIDGVKYRLKTDDPWEIVSAPRRADMRDAVRAAVSEIVDRGTELGARQYDLWEYLHLHNFSRHYSFLMIQSVRDWTECRAPALCNDLLDVATRLPASLKANSTAYLAALKELSPELMKIRNSNTNISAGVPLRQQSSIRAMRKVANLFGGNRPVSPDNSDRSWPPPREIVAASAELQSAIRALPSAGRLDSLGILDMDQIQIRIGEHFSGQRDSSMLLMVLLTMDEFLRQVH
jgi:asparagine synthase (glutamine-hydrolysing)